MAIAELEQGRPAEALRILEDVMSRRKLGTSEPGIRSDAITYLRANFEQAILELQVGDQKSALRTLRRAVAPKK